METEKTIEVPTTALAFKPDIAWWDIERVIPYERNPKKHSEAQVNRLAQTIARFGWDQPIVVDGAGVIIKGHCRREAALKLKINPVPVTVRTDMSPEDVKAARIADNAVAVAPWDEDLLDLEMRDLRLAEYDVNLTALDARELAQLGFEEPPPGETDPDAIPENVETRCKPGDLWQLGAHRLLIGDCTDANAVARLMSGDTAALCFTSPPYADQREYNGSKELSTEHLATFIRAAHGVVDLFAVNLGLSRKDGDVNQYWDDYIKEAKACGLKLLSWNVWDRCAPCSLAQQTAMFAIEHEWILVLGNKIHELNKTIPNKTAGQVSKSSNRDIDGSMIVRPSFDHDKRIHETYSHRRLGNGFSHRYSPWRFPPPRHVSRCTT